MLDLIPSSYLLAVVLVGLVIGSFLNVVIYRLPKMLYRQWHIDATQFLQTFPAAAMTDNVNLLWPSSRCMHCAHPLKYWHNIPLLSFLLLRGHCQFCQQAIAWRYPLVETMTAILSLLVLLQCGVSWQAAAALLYTWLLISLTFIDIDQQLLPDDLTYILLWLGLIINLNGTFTELSSAVIGALVGYLSLWSIMMIFKLITGRQGMGHGDFKLFAALGAWCGWTLMPCIILLASLAGTIIGVTQLAWQKKHKHTPLPFGPYLALSGWLALLYGQSLLSFYTHWVRF